MQKYTEPAHLRTIAAPAPVPAPRDPADTDVLVLTRGEGWAGTYALTVAFMLDDLLSDGAPVTVTITTEDDKVTTTHVVTAVAHGTIECADGTTYDVSDVVSIIVH